MHRLHKSVLKKGPVISNTVVDLTIEQPNHYQLAPDQIKRRTLRAMDEGVDTVVGKKKIANTSSVSHAERVRTQ